MRKAYETQATVQMVWRGRNGETHREGFTDEGDLPENDVEAVRIKAAEFWANNAGTVSACYVERVVRDRYEVDVPPNHD